MNKRMLYLIAIPFWVANGYRSVGLLWPIDHGMAIGAAAAFVVATMDAIARYAKLTAKA